MSIHLTIEFKQLHEPDQYWKTNENEIILAVSENDHTLLEYKVEGIIQFVHLHHCIFSLHRCITASY